MPNGPSVEDPSHSSVSMLECKRASLLFYLAEPYRKSRAI